ncbi:hypothetical protein [Secundilactobacillus silagei]|uniref:hypothetical protein n=1 Tax=Secundilactobacillus silagei TaxID=1293415 RepID=UPI0006D0D1E3|nr:hypothetical protein [Secundilactobacillus silagei]
MLAWAIRGMTFVTNLLLLTGFALLYDWLQRTQFQIQFLKRFRGICQILLTIGFLGFFQLASVFRIMEAHNRKGFGWSYLGFQIGVLIIALFFEKKSGAVPGGIISCTELVLAVTQLGMVGLCFRFHTRVNAGGGKIRPADH